MKHLFVARAIYPAEVGGPSNTIFQMAKGLPDATIVSSDRGMSDALKKKFGIKVNKSNHIEGVEMWVMKSLYQQPLSLYMAIWLYKNIKNYQVVHLSSFFAPLSVFAAIICLLFNIKFTLAPRGELYGPALKIKSRMKRLLMYCYCSLYKAASAFIVTSIEEEESLKSITKLKGKKILITPNSYDFTDFPVIDSNKDSFIFLGRIDPIKNLELMVEAYALYKNKTPTPAVLRIGGTGEYNYVKSLKQLVERLGLSSNIIFHGHITGNNKMNFLNRGIALLLLSKSENFGNVVVEALAQGTPVIVSKGTPWKIVEEENVGHYVNYDIDEISNTLIECYNFNNKQDLSIRCSAFARRCFSSDKVMTQFNLNINTLLKEDK